MAIKAKIWRSLPILIYVAIAVIVVVYLYQAGDETQAGLAGAMAAAAPVVFAVTGETITERAGVINLSVNGTILLSAMAGFAAALATNSVLPALWWAGWWGAGSALLVAFSSITLKQSQVAVGFVLTLLCRDLAYFLGNPIMGASGPTVPATAIPILGNIPVLGTLFFQQDIMTYTSFVLIAIALYLDLQDSPGPDAARHRRAPGSGFLRARRQRQSLALHLHLHRRRHGRLGGPDLFAQRQGGLERDYFRPGWHRLDCASITIFGGWNPLRAAAGAYLFALLQWLGLVLQPSLPNIPSQVLQVAPFPLMILTL